VIATSVPLQVSTILNATYLSITFALIAIGLTLVFGFNGVLNAAHGGFWLIGAYLTVWTSTVTGRFWPSIVVVFVAMVGLGLLMEHLLLKRSYDLDSLVTLLLTFGVLQMMIGAILLTFGEKSKTVDLPPVLADSVTILGDSYPSYQLFVIAAGTVLTVATWGLLAFTNIGLVVRASLLDREMARGLGHDIPTIYTLVFVWSVVLVGWAGMFMVPIHGVNPLGGLTILLEAFALVIIGGLGSFRGTIVAAFILGFVESFATQFISFRLSGVVIYAVLLVVLLIRPYGIFGVKQAAAEN